ncbi:MAG TPA: response regulator transcription factor, partial [Ilumatobacteraceae bacterium]
VARAYRMRDLDTAEELTNEALDIARRAGDVDLELTAISQLGLIRVGQGRTVEGFGLIDEALAAALGGEPSTLDTVVYTCCDMLNACELASDLTRATQWCQAVDRFVDSYGCPFLYAECRIAYGSVLAATGRWVDAERELDMGLRITDESCPALHDRALTRLAGLRIRQGRLEDAELLLSHAGRTMESEGEAALATAALRLARGDAAAASRVLAHRLQSLAEHRCDLCGALDVLVEAFIAAGDVDAASAAAVRLEATASATDSLHLAALSHRALGRVAAASDDHVRAAMELELAMRCWSQLDMPFELARTRFDLASVLAVHEPDASVDHGRRALRAFDELGASVDADRVAAHLRELGVVARIGPKHVGRLTAREQDVLRLLGAGLSNPEIAARLHVSRKTASHHVSSILSKLHLRNRAEAAVYAASTGAAVVGRAGRVD